MSNTTVADSASRLEATIADLFDLDTRREVVESLPEGFGRSGDCTDDGCTRNTCNCPR